MRGPGGQGGVVVGGHRAGQYHELGDSGVGDAVVAPAALAAGLDVAAVGQAGQVGRYAALGQAHVGHAVADRVLAIEQELQQPQPGGVAQGAEELGHRAHLVTAAE
jgi:hypothetical protein